MRYFLIFPFNQDENYSSFFKTLLFFLVVWTKIGQNLSIYFFRLIVVLGQTTLETIFEGKLWTFFFRFWFQRWKKDLSVIMIKNNLSRGTRLKKLFSCSSDLLRNPETIKFLWNIILIFFSKIKFVHFQGDLNWLFW